MEPIAGKTEKWGKHLYFHHTVKIKQYDDARRDNTAASGVITSTKTELQTLQ